MVKTKAQVKNLIIYNETIMEISQIHEQVNFITAVKG